MDCRSGIADVRFGGTFDWEPSPGSGGSDARWICPAHIYFREGPCPWNHTLSLDTFIEKRTIRISSDMEMPICVTRPPSNTHYFWQPSLCILPSTKTPPKVVLTQCPPFWGGACLLRATHTAKYCLSTSLQSLWFNYLVFWRTIGLPITRACEFFPFRSLCTEPPFSH